MTYCPSCGEVITSNDQYGLRHREEQFCHCGRIFYIESNKIGNKMRNMIL